MLDKLWTQAHLDLNLELEGLGDEYKEIRRLRVMPERPCAMGRIEVKHHGGLSASYVTLDTEELPVPLKVTNPIPHPESCFGSDECHTRL